MKTHFIHGGLAAALLLAATCGRAQTLSVTNGLQLWLRADAGVTTNASGAVTQWTDQTTNANNAAQSTDTAAPLLVNNALNAKPVLRFDGTDDFLDVPDSDSLSITGDMSSFFVVRFADFAFYNAVWGKTAGNFPAPTDIYTVPGIGVLRIYRGDGTDVNIGSADSAPLRENANLVMGFDVAGGTLSHYLNNQPNGSGPITTITADGNTPLKIGTRGDNFTRMKGDIAELLIFDRALSTQERSNVFFYLQTKYNLLNLTPNISLSTTPAGPSVNVGDVVTLNATANDPDGTIARVEFLANGAPVGTATAAPYSLRVTMNSAGTVQFTARAIDDKGASANSTPVVLTVLGAGPGDLAVTNGLQLWLRADAGTTVGPGGGVTQWEDQSGNGNHAMQPDENFAPVLTNSAVNGRPALRFDGGNDVMDVADSDSISITGDITSFSVVRFADFNSGFRAIWGKTLNNQPAPTDMYVPTSGGNSRKLVFFRGNGTVNGSSVSGQQFAEGTYLMAGVEMAGTTVRHYYNGLLNGSSTITAPVADANGTLRVGSRADGVTRMKGEMAELLIYNRALSTPERRSLERYLSEKYGMALAQPTNTTPSVAITSPIGQALQAPGTATVTASAADPDGSIVSVQFLVNGVAVGTDTSAPFTTNVNLTYGGAVTVSAIATDNLGGRTTSTPVQVCVQGPGAPTGLVGYWPLDGNAAALIGTSGIMVSNPVPALDRNGAAGGALFFDGALQQRVQVPGGGGLNNARQGTISMWVKWTGVQDTDNVGLGAAGAVLSRQQNGLFSDNIINLNNTDPNAAVVQWRQIGGAATITGTATVGNDIWRHILVTFTETSSELFVEGFSEGTGLGGALNNNASTALAIGAWSGDGGSFATAAIDDVAIWNRVLSSEEVQALAGQTKTPMNLLISPDCLAIERAGGNVTVRWGSEGVLQSAGEVTGTYTNVPSATSPYTAPTTDAARFFRLQSPP